MWREYRIWVLAGAFSLLSVLGACGKVTQEVAAKKEAVPESFTLTFLVDVLSDADIKAELKENKEFPVGNYFTMDDRKVFVSVYGVEADKGLTELSWGQAVVSTESVTVQTVQTVASGSGAVPSEPGESGTAVVTVNAVPVVKWVSRSRNKRYVSIKQSQLGDSLIRAQSSSVDAVDWQVRSVKLRYGYPAYLLSFYGEKNPYYMVAVDAETASKNSLLDLQTLGHYETLIASMYREGVMQEKFALDKAPTIDELEALFTRDFFEEMDYRLPVNRVSKFDVKSPTFRLKWGLESDLFTLLNLIQHSKRKDIIRYIENLPKSKYSKLAKTILISNVEGVLASRAAASGEAELSD